jgi:hypothetical protein
MTQRRVDKEKFERADREAKLALETERRHREAKTARLREQRLAAEANANPERSYSPKVLISTEN